MPKLKDVRGKIFLYNRMYTAPESDVKFGAPLNIPGNTSGNYCEQNVNLTYKIYVQDKYTNLSLWLPERDKFYLVTQAFQQKKLGEVVLNFASATSLKILGVYIMDMLLDYFGEKTVSERPHKFGWTMFDDAFSKYLTDNYGQINIVSLVISSNFNYSGFENTFQVI
jgi:hypothetical protein